MISRAYKRMLPIIKNERPGFEIGYSGKIIAETKKIETLKVFNVLNATVWCLSQCLLNVHYTWALLVITICPYLIPSEYGQTVLFPWIILVMAKFPYI